jgi:hypothetical protein
MHTTRTLYRAAWSAHLLRAHRDSFAPLPWLAFLSLCLSIEDPTALLR